MLELGVLLSQLHDPLLESFDALGIVGLHRCSFPRPLADAVAAERLRLRE
jgi:hypothetical protein